MDNYGGYIFSAITNKDASNLAEPLEIVVNPSNGNVYDSISSQCIGNVFIKEKEFMPIDESEIKQFLLDNIIKDSYKDSMIEFDGFEAGNVVMILMKYTNESKGEYEVLSQFKIDPCNGDIYEYISEKYLGNIIENYVNH
ncbi:hypothetical protein [Marinisporobacter balticus]|nr:hypothetical protein [Marinisporobacter balticus]